MRKQTNIDIAKSFTTDCETKNNFNSQINKVM